MLGITARDSAEIRTGRNRAIGAEYAKILFWGPIWAKLIGTGVVVAGVVWLALKVREVWNGGVGAAVSDNWPLAVLGLLVAAILAGMFRAGSPQRHRRRRRRRR